MSNNDQNLINNGVFIRADKVFPGHREPILMRLNSGDTKIHYGIGYYKLSSYDFEKQTDIHLFYCNGGDISLYANELEYLVLKDIGRLQ